MIAPMHDRVLVRRIEQEQGMIGIPEAYRDKAKLCMVVAVGPGRWIDGVFCKTAVKPGDRVLVPGVGGQIPDIELKDGTFLIQSGDIGAIVG